MSGKGFPQKVQPSLFSPEYDPMDDF